MIDLPAPFVEQKLRRLRRASFGFLGVGAAMVAATLAFVPKPPLAGDPMQPWVVALTLFVFVAVAPMVLIRLVANKEREALAELGQRGQRYAGSVTSRQGSDIVVTWNDEHGDHLGRVQVPDGFAGMSIEVVAANLGKIAVLVDGRAYLGSVL